MAATTPSALAGEHGLPSHAPYAVLTSLLASTGTTTPATSARAARVPSLVMTAFAAVEPYRSPSRFLSVRISVCVVLGMLLGAAPCTPCPADGNVVAAQA